MRFLTEVNQPFINKGIQKNRHECPIALALRHVGFKDVEVDKKVCKFKIGNRTCHKAHLSRSAQRFIKRFDSGKDVKPFRFYLEY